MKTQNVVLISILTCILVFSATFVATADFDWAQQLNIRAEADSEEFRAKLSTRFKIGDVQIRAVLGNVDSPADAYMVFRLGEMSSKPIDHVLQKYRTNKGKGWGALAKSLGIKPGSKEFHALKRGHDIDDTNSKNKGGKKNKGKGKN